MAVSSVNNNNSSAGSYGTGNSAADLSQSFMTLLVAQMKNQDPTNPMDNNQLTSQLAQFNTAAGIEKLNSAMDGVQGMMGYLGSLGAASWVGRTVLVEGEPKVAFGPGVEEDGVELPDTFNFMLDKDAETVTVTLTDDQGNAYTAELKDVKSGVKTYSLDDLEDFKPEAPPADKEYTVTLDAKSAEGEAPTVKALVQEQVQGVTMTADGAMLHLRDRDPVSAFDVYVIQK